MTVRVVVASADHSVAVALRDAGAEVVYIGPADPAAVLGVAVQEDAEAVVTDDGIGDAPAGITSLTPADAPAWLAARPR